MGTFTRFRRWRGMAAAAMDLHFCPSGASVGIPGGGGLPTDQISKLKKGGPALGKNGAGREITGTWAGFSQGCYMATVPTDRRFFTCWARGLGARQGGGAIKLANYQIIKLTN